MPFVRIDVAGGRCSPGEPRLLAGTVQERRPGAATALAAGDLVVSVR